MSLTFPFITGGTVSVNNGSTSVTGSGTAFLTNGVKAGDVLFILSSTAPPVPIGADASSNTALTLGIAFGGSNQSGVPYFIMRAVDAEIVLSAQREFIELYNANANLSVFAALSLVADKLPYANGAGTLALADFKAWGRSMLALTVAANKGLYFTDANTAATFDLTSAGRALLDDADAAAQRTTLGLGSGNAPAFIGIAFPATQSASSDANTLDDYEEGTFTPTMVGLSTAGTGTYGSREGFYTKTAQLVAVHPYIDQSNHTGTGVMQIQGLPFSALSGAVCTPRYSSLTFTGQGYGALAGTNITLGVFSSGAGAGGISMDTSCTVSMSGTYRAT